ncbi:MULTISPECIES: hypothetical protein [Mumia]|uniref:hypothetical protein n=1 Tax=Mumia TaxID=1546255 RepID=UPI00141FE6B4|nr:MULTISPECIES: hypothetical protein [unclassified Mumia]QMW66059.1 hypothetical protein H4N58_18250 [Mumia sp. ZJ1417]
MTASTGVELRISGGLAGTQTVEVAVTENGAEALLGVLDKHEIGYEVLDKRLESLPGGTVLSVGSFHLGPNGSGLGQALQDFARAVAPIVPEVTIGGTPYEIAESGAVASALVALRTAQDAEDAAAAEARAKWERGYEMEQGADDSEEPK